MDYLIIASLVAALGIGIWVGLGAPGWTRGRQDRVVEGGRAQRLKARHLDWHKARRR